MRIGFLIIACMFGTQLLAQTYTVLYERQYWDPNAKTIIKRSTDELTVKDSIGYFYSIINGNVSKLPLGSQFFSHAVYIDLRKSLHLWQSFPLSRKKFLVIDTLRRQEWNIYDDTKNIKGYECLRATCIQNGRVIIAWFAPGLPGNLGPDGFCGLPGIILELNYGGTSNRIIAQDVTFQAKPMVTPSEGKLVSRTEFNKYLARNISRPTRR